MKVKELDLVFNGTGDTKGMVFIQELKSDNAYMYKVTEDNIKSHYEVFMRIEVFNYDFDNMRQLNTKKVTYPTTRVFGKTAWCYNNIDKAITKFKYLSSDR